MPRALQQIIQLFLEKNQSTNYDVEFFKQKKAKVKSKQSFCDVLVGWLPECVLFLILQVMNFSDKWNEKSQCTAWGRAVGMGSLSCHILSINSPIQSNQSTFITNKSTEKLVKTESTQKYYLYLWGFVDKTLLKYSCVFNCFGRKNNLIQYNCQCRVVVHVQSPPPPYDHKNLKKSVWIYNFLSFIYCF